MYIEVERGDLMSAYYRRLTGDNEEEKLRCAKAWSVWEMSTSRLFVDPEYIAHAADDDKFALAFARIECAYCECISFCISLSCLLQATTSSMEDSSSEKVS